MPSRAGFSTGGPLAGPAAAVGLAFDETISLGADPGLDHVRLFVDLAGGQALVMDHVVAARP